MFRKKTEVDTASSKAEFSSYVSRLSRLEETEAATLHALQPQYFPIGTASSSSEERLAEIKKTKEMVNNLMMEHRIIVFRTAYDMDTESYAGVSDGFRAYNASLNTATGVIDGVISEKFASSSDYERVVSVVKDVENAARFLREKQKLYFDESRRKLARQQHFEEAHGDTVEAMLILAVEEATKKQHEAESHGDRQEYQEEAHRAIDKLMAYQKSKSTERNAQVTLEVKTRQLGVKARQWVYTKVWQVGVGGSLMGLGGWLVHIGERGLGVYTFMAGVGAIAGAARPSRPSSKPEEDVGTSEGNAANQGDSNG